jgi:hypothetical protein
MKRAAVRAGVWIKTYLEDLEGSSESVRVTGDDSDMCTSLNEQGSESET